MTPEQELANILAMMQSLKNELELAQSCLTGGIIIRSHYTQDARLHDGKKFDMVVGNFAIRVIGPHELRTQWGLEP